MIPPNVFISYAHDSEIHKQKALDLANKLVASGIDCWIDRYVEGSDPEYGWPMWMEEKVRQANFVLVVASEKYLARFEHRESAGKGLGAKFESVLLLQEVFENDSKNLKFIPVLFEPDDKKLIIGPLKPWTYFNVTDSGDYERLYRRITSQIKIVRPKIGKIHIFSDDTITDDYDTDETPKITTTFIPELPQFTNDMKPGMKILSAFFSLPKTRRFAIASELKLLEDGESAEDQASEKLSASFLIRAKERGVLGELWKKLFDESIDPNPFKN